MFQGAGGRQFLREAETGNLVYCLKQEVQTSLRFEVLNNKFRREWKGEKLQDSGAGVKCARQRVGGKKALKKLEPDLFEENVTYVHQAAEDRPAGHGVTHFFFFFPKGARF